jgi:hypothetical protein
MSCHSKRIRAISQPECASVPGYCLQPRNDRHRIIGRAQYVTSLDAQHQLAVGEQADIIAYILSLK